MKKFDIELIKPGGELIFFRNNIDADKITFVSYGVIITDTDGTRLHIPWERINILWEKNG